MLDNTITLPSKPRIVSEEGFSGIYEIDGLYPGYGHTLGNSLRRIILSSLPGVAVTSLKIDGAEHEFTTLDGVKEDVITIILQLKRVRFRMHSDEPQEVVLSVKGPAKLTAADIETSGQVEVLNPEQYIAEITGKNTEFKVVMRVEKGLGYVPKEALQKEKIEIGTIMVDASFTPIRRANYEVENMRVGDRTDFNRLRLAIETDGSITPHEALERSIETMIRQLQAVVGFQEPVLKKDEEVKEIAADDSAAEKKGKPDTETMKVRVEDLDLGSRTINALSNANIRTVGGLARKKEEDLLEIDGLGNKGLLEIKKALGSLGLTLKQ